MAEFALSNESVLRNMKSAIEQRTRKTLIMQLFDNHPREMKFQEQFKKLFYFSSPANIHNDLCMRNLVQSCISYSNPKAMFQTANRFLAHLFDQDPGINQRNMLCGMIDQVLNLDSELTEFGRFFNSNSYNDNPSTTFIQEINEVNFSY